MPDAPPRHDLDWADALLHVLQRQQALVEQLDALGDGQAAAIDAAQTESLLALLTERQQIIDDLQAAQQEQGRLTERLAERLEGVDEARRGQIRQTIDTLAAQLGRVMRRDADDEQRLRATRDGARDQLGTIGTATQARKAYLAPGGATNRFSDERG